MKTGPYSISRRHRLFAVLAFLVAEITSHPAQIGVADEIPPGEIASSLSEVLTEHSKHVEKLHSSFISGSATAMQSYHRKANLPALPIGATPPLPDNQPHLEDAIHSDFASDARTGRLYCTYQTESSVCKFSNGEEIKSQNQPLDFKTIVRPDGYWTVNAHDQSQLPENVRAVNRATVAEVQSPAAALGDAKFGRIVDPHHLLGENPHDQFSDWLSRCIRFCDRQPADSLPVMVTTEGDRLIITVRVGPSSRPVMLSQYTISREPPHLPLSYQRKLLPSGQTVSSVEWAFQESEVGLFPSMIEVTHQEGQGEERRWIHKKLTITNLKISQEPIDESLFDLNTIGIKEGARVYHRDVGETRIYKEKR